MLDFKQLESCIHCGMCLPVCPTYQVTGSEAESPRGRLYLMRAFSQNQLESPQQLSKHLDKCLGCLACQTACPSGVQYENLLLASRQALAKHTPKPYRLWRQHLLKNVLPIPKKLQQVSNLTRFYVQSGLQKIVRQTGLNEKLGRIGSWDQWIPPLRENQPILTGQRWGKNTYGRVALFTGCIMNAMYARVHQATVNVLVQNGYEVYTPEQTCCGALAYHSGETDIASDLAKSNIETILADNPDYIVINAAGCGSTLKAYSHVVPQETHASTFQAKVVDIMELLAKRPLEGDLSPVDMQVTYHAACHLHHAQGIQDEPYAVLKQIPGLNLIPLTDADMCCGSAGVYNLTQPELSQAILSEKMTHIQATQAQVVLAGNPGCMVQLEVGMQQANLPMQVLHPIEIIDQAYQTVLAFESL